MTDPAEADLVERARRGDLAAFEGVVRRYRATAVGYAWSLLCDYHAAEDAAQEAFVTAWQSLDALRDPTAFVGWLRRLVFTQCNRQQRKRRLPTVELGPLRELLPAPDARPDTDLERGERRQALLAAVDTLSPVLRETVLLYYFGEHSLKEIAAFLEIPAGTVGKRLHDARARLRGKVARMHPSETETERFARRVIERVAAIPFDSTVLGTVVPTLQVAGVPCSWARAAGVLGHAFTFSMHEGCGACCWHGNIDWWLFFDRLEDLGCAFECFQAIQTGRVESLSEAALKVLKDDTWRRVKASVDRGVPAIAWGPMTREQQQEGAAGHDFLVWENRRRRNLVNWALLVGYDEKAKTYVVRHPVRDNDEYEVPLDGFGYLDPVSWYCVLVPGEPVAVDREAVARRSLGDAVRFAEGRRYDPAKACYPVDAEGFAAYALWRQEVEAGTASVQHAAGFARLLTALRAAAADYLAELVEDLPAATWPALRQAEGAYRAELATLEGLTGVCEQAREAGAWDAAGRQRVADDIGQALAYEREAIAAIRAALTS